MEMDEQELSAITPINTLQREGGDKTDSFEYSDISEVDVNEKSVFHASPNAAFDDNDMENNGDRT